MSKINGATLLVKCLEAHGVEFIFGIPGAKIDAVFDALVDSKIKLIVCRHEQNAAFIAASYGRITGKPGVVLVTSGPGVCNLTTGLLTATTEGDPVIAIGGNVPLSMQLKETHQGTDNVSILSSATKYCVEAKSVDTISEVVDNAFRYALKPRAGAAFISMPQDISLTKTSLGAPKPAALISFGSALGQDIEAAASLLNAARCPVLLLGEGASRPENTTAIRALLKKHPFPAITTFQGAGTLSRDLLDLFYGRVGLFKNEPGDILLAQADLVMTIGFNPIEYDPENWCNETGKKIIHLAYQQVDIHRVYSPDVEVLGDIPANLSQLSKKLKAKKIKVSNKVCKAKSALEKTIAAGANMTGPRIHPLRFMHELRQVIDDDTRILCDMGTIHMWLARYFFCYQPHHLMFSNGQQTLGVGLPWAIGAHFADPKQRLISLSGDGGFLFSAMELETAVRENCHFVHFIWQDGRYDMVYEQQLMKYKRESAVDFGTIDIPKFAESFGAKGFVLDCPENFAALYQMAQAQKGPVLIDVPIDYSDNLKLFKAAHDHFGH
jgi:acetolactate synthase I/II/III large subunit